jgi:hypothetical protein
VNTATARSGFSVGCKFFVPVPADGRKDSDFPIISSNYSLSVISFFSETNYLYP